MKEKNIFKFLIQTSISLFHRHEVFKHSSVSIQFIEGVFISLKNKFLADDSTVKRAAIIFLLCKIFFTDDMANMLKLRIISDEWKVFAEFIEGIKYQKLYEPFLIMFYHLYTENLFKFTIKNKALALDYGTPENDMGSSADSARNAIFWSDIQNEIEVIEKSDLIDLMQLNNLKEQAIEPFKKMFPENSMLSDAFAEFKTLKTVITEPTVAAAPAKVSRKEVSQACRTFLKESGAGSAFSQVEIEEVEWESDLDDFEEMTHGRSKKRKEMKRRKKIKEAVKKESSSSDSDSEREFRKMNRTLGFTTQNVMKGIGAGIFPDKLKEVYGVSSSIKVDKN